MSKKILIGKNLRRYKRRFAIIAFIIGTITLILSVFSGFQVAQTFKSIKKIYNLIESNFTKMEEALEFQDGRFSILLLDKTFNYVIEANINQNISKELPLKGEKPYKMQGFESNIYKLEALSDLKKHKQEWVEYVKLTSKFISLAVNNVTIYGEIQGYFDTKQNPKFKNTRFSATTASMNLISRIATGSDLKIINQTEGIFSAGAFEILTNQRKGYFTNKVLFENNDYKITSEMLDAIMKEDELESMLFKKNVIFYDKSENGSIVKGDNAFYNYDTSEVNIYGNVVIISKKNNLEIKAENFIYNEKTKLGSFKPKKNEKISISLDI